MNSLTLFLAIFSTCILTCHPQHFTPLPAPFTEHCIVGEKNVYPPDPSDKVPDNYVIDLDLPPSQRWKAVAEDYQEVIRELVDVLKNLTFPFIHGKLFAWVDDHMGGWDGKFKEPYNEEIKSIAETVGLPLGEMVFFNIFYELNSLCTSIIAHDNNGNMFHARNLDFGLFLGWDVEEHEWSLTKTLRKSIINLTFIKNGRPLYKSTNFAGYVGVFSAMKPNKFTFTLNARRSLADGGYKSIIPFLRGDPTNFCTFYAREVMETADSYSQAVHNFSTSPLAAPIYAIIGGTQPSEATVITRSRAGVVFNTTISPDDFFLLQTNYDPDKAPLFIDDRRYPGEKCMKQLGEANVGFKGIFNVLSSKTNLNKLTTYTVLMEVNAGNYEAWIRKCPDPCWPF